MTTRLIETAQEACAVLPEDLQNDLADLVEAVIASHGGNAETLLDGEQWAELDRRLAGPLRPADPQAVSAFFAKYGL